ncbi:MAG: putative esterase YcpF (UPF0227 family) [Cellvibrionaceae bacterium]|jgi:predicted esterase YcpF (UPF0227 family)
MPTLLYIHGFLSSPSSFKAVQVREYCQKYHPDISYLCPQLPPYPDQCAQQLEALMNVADQPVYLIGSSMGGFWATWLSERYACQTVLVNPAVDPINLMPKYVGIPLKNYHHDETYWLTQQHLVQLKEYRVDDLKQKSQYWLIVQEGDETLDCQLAVEKYAGCKQTVEPGGDHGFQYFERFFDDIVDFFNSENTKKE